ncbi:MAG: gluconate 2-dehydrogenase subunit 3 family protein [Terriglobales bacterium]
MSKPETKPEASLLPRDAATGEPLAPRRQPGYYPGFSTLSQSLFWDNATRQVVTERVDSPSAMKFFSTEEWEFWTAVFGRLIPQADRTPDRRIPVVAPLDHRLHNNQTVGYRYDNMPQDREAYRMGREAIDQEALQEFGDRFLGLPHRQQGLVLRALHDGKPKAAAQIWKNMSVHRFWQLLMGDAIDGYYAHPWAWDEIGFGGPAYPRAYTRLEHGEPEPWEVEEQRYEWSAPESSVSHEVESAAHLHTEADQHK